MEVASTVSSRIGCPAVVVDWTWTGSRGIAGSQLAVVPPDIVYSIGTAATVGGTN